jgi:hypothetical protein
MLAVAVTIFADAKSVLAYPVVCFTGRILTTTPYR